MRITCEVLVSNRRLPSMNVGGSRRRPCQASLGLGRLPGASAEVNSLFVHLCTAQNKQGTKYKVADNLEAVFAKFLSEGKFTLRFKEPEEDLSVKADPMLAKSFLHTLKAGLSSRNLEKLPLSSLGPAKASQLERPRTKMVITKRNDYPLTTSFPYSLEELRINRLKLQRIENRIVKLPRLHSLDMSLNQIAFLPPLMGKMTALTNLYLRDNRIAHLPAEVFKGSLRHTLQSLDLSQNLLEYLPHNITSLRNLVHLALDSNRLVKLPLSLGKLTSLRSFSVSSNRLVEVPASVRRLRLGTLELWDNPFTTPLSTHAPAPHGPPRRGPPTLKEAAAIVCVSKRFKPTPADIPATLVMYLESYLHCLCGRPCFESHLLACIPLDLEQLSTSIVVQLGGHAKPAAVPAMAALCSIRCWEMTRRR